MVESDKKARHYRGKPRPGRRVELSYRLAGAPATSNVQTFTRNIGVGGAFIVAQSPLPPGSRLEVIIPVPFASKTVVAQGEVRWVSTSEEDPVHGMGVQFAPFPPDDTLLLDEFFNSVTQTADHDEVG